MKLDNFYIFPRLEDLEDVDADQYADARYGHYLWLFSLGILSCLPADSMREDIKTSQMTFKGVLFEDIDFTGDYLNAARFSGCLFEDCDFSHTILEMATISMCRFVNCDFSGASFDMTAFSHILFENCWFDHKTSFFNNNLDTTTFKDCHNFPYIPMICPEEGEFIGWKKVIIQGACHSLVDWLTDPTPDEVYIVKLKIPADAKRSSAMTSRKCRCEFADVLDIINLKTGEHVDRVKSNRSREAIWYKVGERSHPDSFDENRWKICTHGIHFFMNRREAEEYDFS